MKFAKKLKIDNLKAKDNVLMKWYHLEKRHQLNQFPTPENLFFFFLTTVEQKSTSI